MAYKLTTRKSWSETQRELMATLQKWGVKEYRLTNGSNGENAPKTSWSETPEQATVSLLLRWKDGRELILDYNRQSHAVDNLRVIYLAAEAMRMNEARGIADLLREAYLQLPAPAGERPKRPPHDVLNIALTAPIEVAEASYRAMAKMLHSDLGGSDAAMAELNEAIETLRADAKAAAR